jgi:glyceraldehyde-3-phosphate dehydrogenase/erythrose-4-phosphate dehydrogenase
VALRLAINGLGRISAQLVRVVNEGGFSDLFEIAAIHDKSGPEAIVRALKNDAVYGPFPGELALEGETLKIGEQEISLSANDDSKNAPWSKSDIPLVIVDGSAANDANALDQHLKKGAKRVILPAASPLADLNLGIGVNESSYDLEKHNIVASAAGAPSAVAMLVQLMEQFGKVRCGVAAITAPATGWRPLLDSPAARGGSAMWPTGPGDGEVYEQLLGKLNNRLSVTEVETSALVVGSMTLGVWLEQRVSEESLRELITTAEGSDELVGLIGAQTGVSSSSDLLRDSRTVVVDWTQSKLLYETFVTISGWFDAEWAAACRLADTLALICEEGVPGTA